MANENKKINELVADDEDPTAELEAITFDGAGLFGGEPERETDADTFGFAQDGDDDTRRAAQTVSELREDLKSRAETIGRLQYDVEQLRSRWVGLETEIKAREEIVARLTTDVEDLEQTVTRKDGLIKKRDSKIRALKAEIRDRDEAHRMLIQEHEAIENQLTELSDQVKELEAAKEDAARPPPPDDHVVEELRTRLDSSETYADSLRRKLQDLLESQATLSNDREYLATLVEQESQQISEQLSELTEANETIAELRSELDARQEAHEEELRTLRFELGEAQNTIVDANELNEQLATDLVDSRNFKEQLETMLDSSEERAQQRIEALEEELSAMSRSAQDFEQKLESKSAAINVLLAELTKKTEQMDSIGELDGVIQEIDYRMSERIEESSSDDALAGVPAADREKVTRVLIGSIGDQVLRFPLFKDRLTIGRTADNDIQLTPSYISRRHAVIVTEGDTTRVIDWGSKNGVYVNSQRVKEHFLSNGDIVAVGNAKFRYEERPKREI